MIIAYRAKRQARAELVEVTGLGGISAEAVISMTLERGPAKTLEQLATAPEKIHCGGFSLADEEYRKRVEASLIKLAESSEALDRVTASHRPREPEYLERGLGERPAPSRRRRRGRSR